MKGMKATNGRFTKGGAAIAVLLALGACSSDDGDDNPFRPIPDDGTTTGLGTTTGDDFGTTGGTGGTTGGTGGTTGGTGGTTGGTGGTTGGTGGTTGGTGGTTGGTGGTTGGTGGDVSVEFNCNGSTLIIGPGDTVTCNGERFTVDASGNVLDSAGNIVQSSGGSGPQPPVGDGALSEQLRTRFASESSFDLWVCQASGGEPLVGYLFPNESVGAYVVIRDSSIAGASEFTYSVNGADSVLLDYPEQGIQEEISGISFSGADSWTGFSTTDGNLTCSLGAVGDS